MIARLSESPGRIKHPGAALGRHNDEIFGGELGLSREEIDQLSEEGVI